MVASSEANIVSLGAHHLARLAQCRLVEGTFSWIVASTDIAFGPLHIAAIGAAQIDVGQAGVGLGETRVERIELSFRAGIAGGNHGLGVAVVEIAGQATVNGCRFLVE